MSLRLHYNPIDGWKHVNRTGVFVRNPAPPPALPGGYPMRSLWVTDDFGDMQMMWETAVFLRPDGVPWHENEVNHGCQ